MGKEPTYNAGDSGDFGSIPGSGKSLGVEHGKPFEYSCLENPVDSEAWWATVHRIAESDTTEVTEHTCTTGRHRPPSRLGGIFGYRQQTDLTLFKCLLLVNLGHKKTQVLLARGMCRKC